MGNGHDYVALDWVRGEIDETLNQARQALEAYVDNTEDTSRMRFCLNYIHQVHGTLQMVEFYGAALLAEEMEKLAQALVNQAVPSLQDAVEVLMQAILQLPSYLEHLHAGRKDLPLVILPILNDLRASRGEPLLSDTSLFTPDLSVAKISPPAGAAQRLQDDKIITNLRKLRQMFQFALAGVIRGHEVKDNSAYMAKVLLRLEKLCQGTALGQLWSVSIAFIEALETKDLELTSATKALLRDLDHQIKRLIDESIDILLQPIPEDLLKHLLYYVAKSETDTDRAKGIRQRYHLDHALPRDEEVDEERQHMQGPDKEAIESVVTALNEELNRIKDQLDLFVRGEFRDNVDLEELLPGLKQVANTMAVLGLGIPRRVILEQVEVIEALVEQQGEAEDSTLMDIAGALLYVEATLTGMTEEHAPSLTKGADSDIPAEQLNSAHDALLREARNGLEQAKTSIVNFIASHWDHSEIEGVPAILDTLRGGLQIIPLTKASDLLNSCSQYVQQALLSNKNVPDWKQLDTLADAITSIEYYIERLTEGAQDNELILKVAEESVTELGFPPGQAPTYSQASTETSEVMSVQENTTAQDSASKEADAELIDDEIIEIFVEEAEEVLETIADFYPKFRKDTNNKEALIEIRRAFHTLKGSGRLVGAIALGELAWSVENMLNRILDNTIQPSELVFELLDEVIGRIPNQIEAFKTNQAAEDAAELITRAEAICGTPKPSATKQAAIPEAEASASPSTNTASDDDDNLIDDEIIEIFIEEAEEVLETIEEFLPAYLKQHDNSEALTELRRAFHTLKGSGRMVGAEHVGELAWSVENMMNRIIDGSILMNQDIADVLTQVTPLFPLLVEDFRLQRAPSLDTAPIIQQAERLAQGEIVPALKPPSDVSSEEEQDVDIGVDPILLDIFKSETDTHLDTINEFVELAESEGELAFNDAISRALHTLKGSANTANIAPIAHIIIPVEKFVKEARARNIPANPAISEMLRQASGYVHQGIEQLYNDPQHDIEGTEEFLMQLGELSELTFVEVDDIELVQSTTTDPQLISIFLTEGIDILLDAESILSTWRNNPVPGEQLEKLVGELKTLSNGAQVAGLDDISEFADLLENAYEGIESGNVVADDDVLETIAQGHEALLSLMDQVAAGLATQPNNKLIAELKTLIIKIDEAKTAAEEAQKLEASEIDLEAEEAEQAEQALAEQEALKALDDEIPTLSAFTPEEEEIPTLSVSDEPEEIQQSTATVEPMLDPELVEIFLEEANDIVNNTGELLQQWSENTDNQELLAELQRDLHTLKGGARLAGISGIGDLSHELETLLEGITEGRFAPNEELLPLLFSCHDRLATMIENVASGTSCITADDLLSDIERFISASGNIADTTEQSEELTNSDLPLVEDIVISDDETAADEAIESLEEVAFEEESTEEIPLIDTETEQEPAATSGTLIDLDPELVEIFLEEANDIIDNSGNLIHQWQEDPTQQDTVAQLQRELHTLKGGARMAEISAIGDLAHELESLFEKMVDGQIPHDDSIIALSLEVHDRLAAMVDNMGNGIASAPATDLIGQITARLNGETSVSESTELEAEKVLPEVTDLGDLETIDSGDLHSETDELEEIDFGDLPTLELEDDKDHDALEEIPSDEELLAPETDLADEVVKVDEVAALLPESLDPELVEIFLEEANEIVDKTGELLQVWLENISDTSNVKELQRELHTLKGGARMAEIAPLGDLAHELETLFEGIVDNEITVDSSISDLMLACHDRLALMVESLGNSQPVYPANELVNAVVALLGGEAPQPLTGGQETLSDASEADIIVHEEEAETLSLDDSIDEEPEPEELLPESTEIEDIDFQETTPEAEEIAPADIEDTLSEMDVLDAQADAELLELFLDEARDLQEEMTDSLELWQEDPASLKGVIEIQRELHTLKGGARLADIDSIGDLADALYDKLDNATLDNREGALQLIQLTVKCGKQLFGMLKQLETTGEITPADELIREVKDTAIASSAGEALPGSTESLNSLPEDVDEEVIEIFLEEAGEILEAMETQLADWSTDATNNDFNREIQRLLHTLKGGARLAGLVELGNTSHDLETKLIESLDNGGPLDKVLSSTISQYQDKLVSLVDEVKHRFGAASLEQQPDHIEEQVQPVETVQSPDDVTDAEAKQADEPETAGKPSASVVQTSEPDRVTTTAKATTSQSVNKAKPAQQETVRVPAGLIDDLVNLAGETSITRGRLEQQISDFSFNLDEMVATIERLREQLRRMDMETEAQVLFQTEKEGIAPDYADFDPLEMDRYSSIQQLSRALTESTSDLLDLQETLADKTRDAETLLLQQSRINTELQEGLMKTRMIPFSSMVPRLRRIVRQICGELGKKADFDVRNAEGEMDRTVLERMIAPLEHMLRNALDHGIESIDKRKASGKPESGKIDLSLNREGGDIVLRMKDDGGGIPIQAIKDKAISQGLMKEDAQLSDHDILQFIMQAGFSTAEQVTQISGRGVGMDVVASEIKQLGGTISIDSKEGFGTTFTVRLPFTVSVNRALMVNTGEDFYAIPLNTIEGIVRVSPYELEEYYKPDSPLYEYAGQQYHLQYLGNVMHTEHKPKLQGQPLPLPVILVRGTDQPMAIQVDSLMGSREIVVKGLGPQFGGVQGVSGATILGDGSVVVILDLPALIRADIEAMEVRGGEEIEVVATVEQRPTLVMVVDDSVTVRKVTSRLLERNGMDVITAKDGVDAIAQLQDHKPDVMLLDIEMPRMDGFEVASLVRHDENLKDVPICMITSRTGQKHRDRAMSIGVNEYLGKPFQEKELLSTIEKLTERS